MTTRERFEAAMRKAYPSFPDASLARDDHGNYIKWQTQACLNVWQVAEEENARLRTALEFISTSGPNDWRVIVDTALEALEDK